MSNIPKLVQPSIRDGVLSGLGDIATLTQSTFVTVYRLSNVDNRFSFLVLIGTEFLPFELYAPAGSKLHRKLKAVTERQTTTCDIKLYNRHYNGVKMPLVSQVHSYE